MRKDKIAVLGDKDSILSFKAIGFDAYDVVTEEEARAKLKALAMNYKIIYLTEDLASALAEQIEKYQKKALPIIVPIPTLKSNTGFGMRCVHENVERAIGTDILNNKK